MEILLQIKNKINSLLKKRFIIFIIFNIILITILYLLPLNLYNIELCVYKTFTGKECFNCGMTRAFLSILHFDFAEAIKYNWRVIIVFPYTLIIYLYCWIKYILKNEKNKKEEKK